LREHLDIGVPAREATCKLVNVTFKPARPRKVTGGNERNPHRLTCVIHRLLEQRLVEPLD
jgi:hypothetical protein